MKKYILIIILSIASSSVLFAHGVNIVTITGGTGIEARYAGGDPIAHAEVAVYSPNNSEDPFQTGITDQNGRFLFYPDRAGEWKVVVSDWSGHGGNVKVQVNEEMKPVSGPGGMPAGRGEKVITGVAVIFGITGILFFLVSRRERRRQKDAHS